ncbi:hypothetical protein [Yersinia rohdei]|uniref:hypothetical protein n=1 Tax=Yersinia rohdei TaxID=29485 RepID=UPI0011A39806|nr:hypothetical protein [Yersinia rohdei]
MSFLVGSFPLFTSGISQSHINGMHLDDSPPHLSLWEKIKDFFCLTHKEEALQCIFDLHHLDGKTTREEIESICKKLEEFAAPGYKSNISLIDSDGNYLNIKDNNGRDVLSVKIDADGYMLKCGLVEHSYHYTPPDKYPALHQYTLFPPK